MKKHCLATVLMLFLTLPSMASAFRCQPGEFASRGDTKSEIRLKCGPPVHASYEGIIKVRGKFVHVDRWTYSPGRGKFYQLLQFHDGVLRQINSGPRVK